jgi:hypothetical protein
MTINVGFGTKSCFTAKELEERSMPVEWVKTIRDGGEIDVTHLDSNERYILVDAIAANDPKLLDIESDSEEDRLPYDTEVFDAGSEYEDSKGHDIEMFTFNIKESRQNDYIICIVNYSHEFKGVECRYTLKDGDNMKTLHDAYGYLNVGEFLSTNSISHLRGMGGDFFVSRGQLYCKKQPINPKEITGPITEPLQFMFVRNSFPEEALNCSTSTIYLNFVSATPIQYM